MQMHLSSDVQITDGLLATNALLAENSRQGFETYSGTLHQGFEVAISSTSLGISNPLYDGRVRSRCTGKERDAESGLDYFGARYMSSSMGRFMSPDFSGSDEGPPDAVPYADFTNPQSLNLYGYVQNNPLKFTDPDGHDCVVQTRTSNTTETVSVSTGNCDKINVGDGQTKTYIAGTVDTNSIKGDGSGGITLGFTPYAGGGDSGVADLKGAPIPDSTNLAYGWGNNAQGYQKLSTANQAVGTLKGVGIFYGASAVGAVGVLAAPVLPEVGQQAVAFLESRGVPATAALAKVLWALSKAGQNNPPIGTVLKELGGRLAQEYKQQHPN
jgi:RHS repeat-associated protein